MGNIVELKQLVKDTLNTYSEDPYNNLSSRPGNLPQQFFNEADGLNLTRGDSFPKGFIKSGGIPSPMKDNIGRTGWIKKYGEVDIYYFVKEKNNYIKNNITYTDGDLVEYMLNNIQTVLLNNRQTFLEKGYAIYPNSFGDGGDVVIDQQAKHRLYRGLIPVTFYWYERYGE